MSEVPEHDRDQSNSALGLRPRLLAAAWFAIAALLPVGLFLGVFGGVGAWLLNGPWASDSDTPSLFVLWLFGVVPVSAAAFWGFTVGSRLTDITKESTAFRTAIRGISVALLSYLLFMAFYAGAVMLGNLLPNQDQALNEFPYWWFEMFVVGLVFVGWLIVIAGAIAGPTLKDTATSTRLGKALCAGARVSRRRAIWWTLVAAVMFLSNYLVFMVLLVRNGGALR